MSKKFSGLHSLELLDVGRKIQSEDLTAVDVTQAQFDTIARVDGHLGGYLAVIAEQYMFNARQAQGEFSQGRMRSPLHGAPSR
jgi:amidase